VILVDSDALVALVNRRDREHRACVGALQALREPLGTVWPVLAAALTSTDGYPAAQAAILEMVARGAVRLLPLGQEDAPRLRELIAKQRPKPMSLAHAALIRVAERDGVDTALTLASAQFGAYRIAGRKTFRLLPKVLAKPRRTSGAARRSGRSRRVSE
jgi:predicted nucleic acid-binding protein